MKFTRIPVYAVSGNSTFKVEIFSKAFASYEGDQNLDAVANWIEEATEEVIINIASTAPSKKLNRALENQTPLLIIINRDDSDAFKAAFSFL